MKVAPQTGAEEATRSTARSVREANSSRIRRSTLPHRFLDRRLEVRRRRVRSRTPTQANLSKAPAALARPTNLELARRRELPQAFREPRLEQPIRPDRVDPKESSTDLPLNGRELGAQGGPSVHA